MSHEDEGAHQPRGRIPGRPIDRPAGSGGPDPGRPLHVEIDPPRVRVDPGGSQTLVVRVRNTGHVVDEVTLRLHGEAAAWARIAPSQMNLYPGTAGEALLHVAPPKASLPEAGLLGFAIDVSSSSRPQASVTQRGAVEIAPFDDLSASLEPRSGTLAPEFVAAVKVRNAGNHVVTATIAPAAGDGLRLLVAPDSLTLAPGQEATAWVTVTVSRTGRPPARTLPFALSVGVPPASRLSLDGRVELPAAGRRWLPAAAAAVALLLLVGGALAAGPIGDLLSRVFGPDQSPTPVVAASAPATTPSPVTAGASQTPAATATIETPVVTPTAGVTPTAAAPETPSPETPTVAPDSPTPAPPTPVSPLVAALGRWEFSSWSERSDQIRLEGGLLDVVEASDQGPATAKWDLTGTLSVRFLPDVSIDVSCTGEPQVAGAVITIMPVSADAPTTAVQEKFCGGDDPSTWFRMEVTGDELQLINPSGTISWQRSP